MVLDYKIAKQKLLTDLDYECQQFLLRKGYALEYGYSLLLNDDIVGASDVFRLHANEDLRSKWAYFLVSLIKGEISEYPTYIEIRDFLEIDLDILIRYYKGDYVEKIIRYADFLFSINPEVYKFIGRVFYNNDLNEQSMFFLDRAKSYFYNDPELHCLLAQIYYNEANYRASRKSVDDCLKILPDYYPALNILNKLNAP